MEFVCNDPNAMVRAANVKATLDAFNLVPELGKKIVEAHKLNIEDLRPENMVPVQRWLDALREIQHRVGIALIQNVGRNIIVNADFPPHFESVEQVLEALDTVYHMNHTGDVGHYRFEKKGAAVVVHCETPYPRGFELGLIEGIADNPRLTRGNRYFVTCEDAPPGGLRTCSVTVRRFGK